MIKIALFLIVNAVGFYTIPTIITVCVMWDMLPDVTDKGDLFYTYQFLIITAAIPVWALASLASVGYFFTSSTVRTWLLLAPIYVPAIYAASIITYFHFV